MAVRQWREYADHRAAQRAGRETVFQDYRLRVATVVRDYGMTDRSQAPVDAVHD
jgi:heme-degrading monooxygenase HmoA